ncbi:hypothetical protein JOM56_001701 [Amanita muscaria]
MGQASRCHIKVGASPPPSSPTSQVSTSLMTFKTICKQGIVGQWPRVSSDSGLLWSAPDSVPFATVLQGYGVLHSNPYCDQVNGYVHAFRIHNISAERSWLRLRLDFGDNAVLFFNKGIEEGVYNSDDANHYQLCQWLWPRLLQKELDKFMEFRNGCMMRKDKEKPGPSGMSHNQAFSLPEMWGGRDCLLGLTDENLSMIQELKAWLGGDKLVSFSKPEFSARAQEAYNSLAIVDLTFENVWGVFTAMLPLVFH